MSIENVLLHDNRGCGRLLEALSKHTTTSEPEHKILVFIAYAQIPLINAYTDVPCGNSGLHVGLSLHRHPYFACACSEGSSEYAHIRRLA